VDPRRSKSLPGSVNHVTANSTTTTARPSSVTRRARFKPLPGNSRLSDRLPSVSAQANVCNEVIQLNHRRVLPPAPSIKDRELRASGWSVHAPAFLELLSLRGKVDASICKPLSRARAARTGGTHVAGTSRSRQQSIARGIARLSPAAVAEREQAERKEQQWQKEHMATAHNEHDHRNRKADSKHTHQRLPSKQCLSGLARQPAPSERRPARTVRFYFVSPSRTSPRQAPVSSSRFSISCLNRSRSPRT
jgi:hypothetical protein